MRWQERGACVGVKGFHDPTPDGIKAAVDLCNDRPCPVRRECFAWARSVEYDGVAGGHWMFNGEVKKPPKVVRVAEPPPPITDMVDDILNSEDIKAGWRAYKRGETAWPNGNSYRLYERARKLKARAA